MSRNNRSTSAVPQTPTTGNGHEPLPSEARGSLLGQPKHPHHDSAAQKLQEAVRRHDEGGMERLALRSKYGDY